MMDADGGVKMDQMIKDLIPTVEFTTMHMI